MKKIGRIRRVGHWLQWGCRVITGIGMTGCALAVALWIASYWWWISFDQIGREVGVLRGILYVSRPNPSPRDGLFAATVSELPPRDTPQRVQDYLVVNKSSVRLSSTAPWVQTTTIPIWIPLALLVVITYGIWWIQHRDRGKRIGLTAGAILLVAELCLGFPCASDIAVYVLLLLPTSFLASGLVSWRIESKRIPPGHCKKCSYNLTGNVSGICPECGTAVEIGEVK